MNYRIEEGCIVFTIDEDERKILQQIHDDDPEHFDTDDVMCDWYDHLIANSELNWCSPYNTGDLTDAPMLCITGQERPTGRPEMGDGHLRVGYWNGTHWGEPILKRWAFMSYAITTPQRQLLEKMECRWEGGDFMEPSKADKPLEVAS